jgi:D-xylose transport system substrate-binding protein
MTLLRCTRRVVALSAGLAFAVGILGPLSVGSAATKAASSSASSLTVSSFTSDFSAMAKLKSLVAKGKGKVVALLPDTQSSARYVAYDAPFLDQAFKAAGFASGDYQVQNAQGSAQTMQTQAEAAITNGASVLLVDPLDSGSGAAIESNAKSKGVKTIDYDRLTLNGSSDYYVSFDNVKVGQRIGQGFVNCVSAWGVKTPQVLVMDGDPTDNNATLFNKGYISVLTPKFKSGAYKKVAEPAGTWDNQKALTIFQQQYTAHPNINSAVTPNDGVANSVISGLKTLQIQPKKFPTTGQDATTEGLQNILAGYQCMTVYKPIYQEAQAAAALAVYLRANAKPPAGLVNGKSDNKTTQVPSVLLNPINVDTSNMASTVVKDGFVSASDLCTGALATACTAAGINK